MPEPANLFGINVENSSPSFPAVRRLATGFRSVLDRGGSAIPLEPCTGSPAGTSARNLRGELPAG